MKVKSWCYDCRFHTAKDHDCFVRVMDRTQARRKIAYEGLTGKCVDFVKKESSESNASVSIPGGEPGYAPRECSVVRFDQLMVGDRFEAHGGKLWTKVDHDVARKHSKESMAMKDEGYGYIGDSLCSFELSDVVSFIPPNAGIERPMKPQKEA